MKINKLCAISLSIFTFLGAGMSVAAEEGNIDENSFLQDTIFNLEEGYSEYYNILETDVTLCSSCETDKNVENTYLVEMTAVLKAKNVEEMDYYKGVEEYCNAITTEKKLMSEEKYQVRVAQLTVEERNIYEELQKYIGEEQNLIFYIKETYPTSDESSTEILFENGMDYVTLEEMLPAHREELKEDGFATMELLDLKKPVVLDSVSAQKTTASYSVDDTVKYMTTYTSNPSSCNVCGSGCNSKVDTTKYNSSYKHYVSKGKHVDCANYVSQALSAGGISTDSTWKAESDAWINVAKLTDYMTSNSHWSSVAYNQVQKGDIVSFTSYSHVVMITSFDGTTYKYSGHTNDRLNSVITIKSSNKSSYNFYRVS